MRIPLKEFNNKYTIDTNKSSKKALKNANAKFVKNQYLSFLSLKIILKNIENTFSSFLLFTTLIINNYLCKKIFNKFTYYVTIKRYF